MTPYNTTDNRIFAIDIPFEDIYELEGLLWKNDNFYCVTGDGTQHPLKPPISDN